METNGIEPSTPNLQTGFVTPAFSLQNQCPQACYVFSELIASVYEYTPENARKTGSKKARGVAGVIHGTAPRGHRDIRRASRRRLPLSYPFRNRPALPRNATEAGSLQPNLHLPRPASTAPRPPPGPCPSSQQLGLLLAVAEHRLNTRQAHGPAAPDLRLQRPSGGRAVRNRGYASGG